MWKIDVGALLGFFGGLFYISSSNGSSAENGRSMMLSTMAGIGLGTAVALRSKDNGLARRPPATISIAPAEGGGFLTVRGGF